MQEESKENYCTLYLVRHGETEWNVNAITMGHLDSPLTETGIEQAQTTAAELKDIRFDAIFSSDSPRAQRTAEMIRLDRELVVQTSKLLRERNYGRFEGKPADIFREAIKDRLEERKRLSEREHWLFKLADDVETDGEILTRFIIQLREIAVAYPKKTVLVVSHGGCIRTFLIRVGYAKRAELPPGSFQNAGYVKVLSSGVDFLLKEVKGARKVKEIE